MLEALVLEPEVVEAPAKKKKKVMTPETRAMLRALKKKQREEARLQPKPEPLPPVQSIAKRVKVLPPDRWSDHRLALYVRAAIADVSMRECTILDKEGQPLRGPDGEILTWSEALAEAMFVRAVDGDDHAAKILVEQLDGKPSQRVELDAAGDLGLLIRQATARARGEDL